MKKQVLASIHKICEELESLSMHKEASSLTDVMKKIAARGDRASVVIQSDGTFAIHITNLFTNKYEIKLYYKTKDEKSAHFTNLQHALNYARKIDSSAKVINPMPRGKPLARDDQRMFDFEAPREDKY